jgi:hypothetical protein
MRWLAITVLASACTTANPAFDLVDGNSGGESPESLEEGEDEGEVGTSEDGSSTGDPADCAFESARKVELTVDDEPICGDLYSIAGFVESVTDTQIRIHCAESFDSDCIPGALGVLTINWGLPPELVVDPARAMQLQFSTGPNCEFRLARLQAADEPRELFLALGPPVLIDPNADLVAWEAMLDEACECGNECCTHPAGTYRLSKEIDGELYDLAEGESAIAEVDGFMVRYTNVASHVKYGCTKVFHWQSIRL